ncbi:pyrroline-5-carboxylate reductase [Mesobacillus zeae]|uniref:Pyrroline-5-carboxylate reductase n=1 Tax=Mesobacillus zeae TaxID=1917180 RepID=A0A398B7S6_9BACI|nr:pyrroline-5-carboxylate reductase [Mesobacillus zeae]RID83960.1 pyrroline-5-carboxylate reductase [Mesobacillus zeae]
MKKLVFAGAGSIAEALISGITQNRLLHGSQIWATNRGNGERLDELNRKYGIHTTYNQEELYSGADAVILAMKPKDAANALGQIGDYLGRETLVISVLAGVSFQTIEQASGKPLSVIRAMPNTSAAIGQSATALAANARAGVAEKELAKTLFETVGTAAFVAEDQLDAVTGLSGSGPAYIYYLVEAMEKSAVEIGLDRTLAKELIVQTLIGAAGMLSKSEKTPEQLRYEVTSPGGTTEAGIGILEQHGVQEALVACIKEAAAHSGKMGNTFSCEPKQIGQPQ